MKKYILGIFILLLISACSVKNDNYLIKYYQGEFDEFRAPSGYLNSKGDTIIPIGKYLSCLTDTIRNFGMVIENKTGKILGINQNAIELFEVYKYDNGPDYIKNGLFRIIKNEKIGYANINGEIKIEPHFDCAYPFEGDFAKVSNQCESRKSGEYLIWKSDNWFQITKDGKRVEE